MNEHWRPGVRGWGRPIAATAVVEFLAVAGTLGSSHQHPNQSLDWLGVALVAIAAGVILIARRLPLFAFAVALATTALYVVLGYPTDSPHFLGLMVVAYAVGAPDSRVRTAIFAAATLLTFAGTAPITRAINNWAWPALAILVVAALTAGQLAAELSARAERRSRESREQAARRQLADERLRIARELHDVVSHSIAMINVQAGVAVHVMDDQPEQARQALVTIKAASHEALRDLRAILGLLRSTDEAEDRSPAPGLAELSELVAQVRRAGVIVSMQEDGLTERLPAPVELVAYRLVQEALTNVVRHAPGATARVDVHRVNSHLVIDVENSRSPAPGMPESRSGAGQGLLGMRERVRAAGGELETGPTSGGGFAVRAWLPIPAAAS